MKHHYIPQFYLKQWADPSGQVLRYKKLPDGRVMSKRLFPKAIGYRDDLYRSPYPEEKMAQRLERDFFQRLDDIAAAAMAELTVPKLRILPDEPLHDWVHFMMSLLFRQPTNWGELHRSAMRHYKVAVDAARREIEASPDMDNEHADGILSRYMDDTELTKRLHASFRKIVFNENVISHLSTFEWMIMDVPLDHPTLLLSDDPMMRPVGLKNEHAHIATPLSPRKLLIGMGTRQFATHVSQMRAKEIVQITNTSTVQGAREFVAALDDRQAAFITKHFGSNPKRPLASAQNEPTAG
ncbi:DUF4238 domain-containing protein [Sphingomonas sp. HH69]